MITSGKNTVYPGVPFAKNASINCVLATSQEYCGACAPRAQAPGVRNARAYHSTPAFLCAKLTEKNGMPTPSCRVKGHEIDGGGSAHDLVHPLQRPDAQWPGLFPDGRAEPPGAARCRQGHPQEAAGAAFGALPRGHF